MVNDFLLLFVGAFAAAAISGSAGFGGALLLLPLLTHSVGPSYAAPLLTMAQIIGNGARMVLGWRHIRWRPVGLFLCTGLPAAILGALCFISIPKPLIVRLTGAAIFLFVLLRLSGKLRFRVGKWTLLLAGLVTGFLSGLLGSAGPVGPAVFLSLDLPPLAYVASDATTSLIMHVAKTATYQSRFGMPADLWLMALLLGLAMILGTWTSKWLVERVHPDRFRVYVTVLLAVIALQMVIAG